MPGDKLIGAIGNRISIEGVSVDTWKAGGGVIVNRLGVDSVEVFNILFLLLKI